MGGPPDLPARLGRTRLIAPAERSAEQAAVVETISAGRGFFGGPFAAWLHSPGFADRAQALGKFVRFDSALPPRLSELVILIVGRHWGADFEWHAHAPIALAAGLPAPLIEAIRTGSPLPPCAADETAVAAFATELLATRHVGQPTYDAAAALLDERQLTDLVGIIGYYCLICMTLNAFEIPTPDGSRPLSAVSDPG